MPKLSATGRGEQVMKNIIEFIESWGWIRQTYKGEETNTWENDRECRITIGEHVIIKDDAGNMYRIIHPVELKEVQGALVQLNQIDPFAEIETLNKIARRLADIVYRYNKPYPRDVPCQVCGYSTTSRCSKPDGVTCIDGVIKWARRQVEEEAGR
jgi:hypothetical protein